MRARLTMIATAAGLAVAVFLAGALGLGGSDGSRALGSWPRPRPAGRGHPRSRGGRTDRSRRRSGRWSRGSPPIPRTGRLRPRWGSRTSNGSATPRTPPRTRWRRQRSLGHWPSSREATPMSSSVSGRWRRSGTTSPARSVGGVALRGSPRSTPTSTVSSATRSSSSGGTPPPSGRSSGWSTLGRTSSPTEGSVTPSSSVATSEGAIAAMRAAYDVAASRADTAWAAAHIANLHFHAGRIEAGGEVVPARQSGGSDLDGGTARPRAGGLDLRRPRGGDHRPRSAGDAVSRAGSPRRARGALRRGGEPRGRRRAGRAGAGGGQVLPSERSRYRSRDDVVRGRSRGSRSAQSGYSARAALRSARAEWSRRTSVHVADAFAWALYANGNYRKASDTLVGSPETRHPRRTLPVPRGDDPAPARGRRTGPRSFLEEAFDVNPYFSVRWSPVLRDTLAGLRDR